nr:hypothetical protein [Tanacetum cinerariifolium]
HYTDAKDIWDNVKMLLEGETIHDYYVQFAKLINDMRNIKMTMSIMQLNSKFVNNMLPEWEFKGNPRGGGAAGYEGAQNRVGNANQGQARQIKCYNYNGGHDNAIDEDVDEQPIQDLVLNIDNVFQEDDCDAFDSDVDEAPMAQTMFMANLSSTDPVYDKAYPSYDSNILSKYVKDNAMLGVQSNVSSVLNDAYMMIYNDMYEPHAQSVSKTSQNIVVDNSLTAKLATYKEQVELHERRAMFELTEREPKIDEQLRIVITGYNFKEETLKKEPHYVKFQLASTINHNKSMVEDVTSLKKDFKQKENKYLEEFLDMKSLKVKPALYNGHEIIKNNHVPAIVHNTEDTLVIAEITRRKINDKMKDPKYVNHKAKITPHDYSKENFLATFTPQKKLTRKQIFLSQDLIKMKAKALKEQTTASRPIKALTVYPPNIPAMLVLRVLPTKCQVKINIFTLIQFFLEFDKTCKKKITPTGLTKGKGVLNKLRNVFSRRKHDEIERKNLLIANDNLIAECLSKEVFYVARNSEFNVSRFTEMHVAHTIVKARCLELEAELSNLRDKIHNDNHNEFDDKEADMQMAVEESLKSVHDAHRGPLPPMVFREPDSGKFQPLPKMGTPVPTEPSSHVETLSIHAKLGLTNSDMEFNEEVPPMVKTGAQDKGQIGPNPGVQIKGRAGLNPGDEAKPQPQSSLVVHFRLNLKHIDLEATNENLKLTVEENEKTTAKTKAESMVSVIVHQDTNNNNDNNNSSSTTSTTTRHHRFHLDKAMANLIQDNKYLEERLDSNGSRLYKPENLNIPQQVSKAVDEIVTDAVDLAIQAPLWNCFRDSPEADIM